MNTKIIKIHDNDQDVFIEAGKIIRSGGLVAFPTETVYGLGANALDSEAVAGIFRAKGRPQDNPLISHIADFQEIYSLCREVPPEAELLAENFWPGPLTMVLKKSDAIPMSVSAGLDTAGIRLPSHPAARALIRAAGVPIAAPSANTSGKPSPTTAAHVLADMDGKIDMILDGGACSVGLESTVVSLCGERPRLLRPGGITLEQLESVLGKVDVDRAIREQISTNEKVSAPGMKYRHYAPRAPVTIISGTPEHTAGYIRTHISPSTGVLCFDEYVSLFESAGHVRGYGSVYDISAQARQIFDALRGFDSSSVTEILAQCPSDIGLGLAVANRLKKAAGFNIIEI